MSEFLTKLNGDWLDDDVRYMLGLDLRYRSDIVKALNLPSFPEGLIVVPAGFVTDFASVPRIPIIYELFGDRAHHESVIHDYLYQTHQGLDRQTCDRIFREAMQVRGKSKFVWEGMYLGVRLGGWNSYRTGPSRYLKLNPQGGIS